MSQIVIAGCGYVGNALAAMLLEGGHEVFGIRRDPNKLAAGVRPIAGDLTQSKSLAAAPPGVELGVFAVAANGDTEAAYRRAYIDALAGFLRWLADADQSPRRLVMLSSTAVYGQRDGELVDETSPTEPSSFRGKVMLAAEQLAAASGLPTIIVRLGGIYGPGRHRAIDRARLGLLQKRGYPHYTNRIHRDDAAGLLHHLLFVADPARLYVGVDDEPAEEGELFDWLAARLGCTVAKPDGSANAAPSARASGIGSKRCSNRQLRESGYALRFPSYRQGFGALLDRDR